jgi:TetR/AcrR family transcriptional repressor of mexJK operon
MPPEDKDRRQQILDAAQSVFAQKGFEGASIKDLAQAAEISPGLLYWYFKDKTDLFTSLLTERIEAGFGVMPEMVSYDLPPEEFLRRFGHFYIGLMEQPMNTALFKVMIANTQSFPAVVRQVETRLIARVLGTLQGYLQGQVDARRLRPCDTDIVARTYMGSIVAFLMLRHIMQDKRAQELPIDKMVDGVTDVVLHGILPPDK